MSETDRALELAREASTYWPQAPELEASIARALRLYAREEVNKALEEAASMVDERSAEAGRFADARTAGILAGIALLLRSLKQKTPESVR